MSDPDGSDPHPRGPFRVRVRAPAEPAIVRRIVRGDIGATGATGADGIGATPRAHPLAVATAGQTSFPLPIPPGSPADVILFVNGAAYRTPTIALTPVLLTWAGGFDLSPGDTVFAVYA